MNCHFKTGRHKRKKTPPKIKTLLSLSIETNNKLKLLSVTKKNTMSNIVEELIQSVKAI